MPRVNRHSLEPRSAFPLPLPSPAIVRPRARCLLALAGSSLSRGHRRRWRMIHNWGRFGGHKTTRKWVRTLITGHIFRSLACGPTNPHYTERRLMAPAADSYCRNATRAPSAPVPLPNNRLAVRPKPYHHSYRRVKN